MMTLDRIRELALDKAKKEQVYEAIAATDRPVDPNEAAILSSDLHVAEAVFTRAKLLLFNAKYQYAHQDESSSLEEDSSGS